MEKCPQQAPPRHACAGTGRGQPGQHVCRHGSFSFWGSCWRRRSCQAQQDPPANPPQGRPGSHQAKAAEPPGPCHPLCSPECVLLAMRSLLHARAYLISQGVCPGPWSLLHHPRRVWMLLQWLMSRTQACIYPEHGDTFMCVHSSSGAGGPESNAESAHSHPAPFTASRVTIITQANHGA